MKPNILRVILFVVAYHAILSRRDPNNYPTPYEAADEALEAASIGEGKYTDRFGDEDLPS